MDQAVADIADAVGRPARARGRLAIVAAPLVPPRSAQAVQRHSAQNTIWLWQQAMMCGAEMSMVGGYRWWQGMGRQVRRGEHAFWVVAPVSAKVRR
jgi:hypothetical protein